MSVTTGTLAHGPAGTGHVDKATKERQWRLVVLFLLASDVTFVAALFFSYLYLRQLDVNHMWLPASVHPAPMSAGLILAGLLVLSSLAYRWGDVGLRKGNQGQLRGGLTIALVLWIVEMVVGAQQLLSMSFGPGAGGYASAFYALAGYHMFHLVLGLLLGLGMFMRAGRGRFAADNHTQVQVLGYFWYWVAVMAIAMALLPA